MRKICCCYFFLFWLIRSDSYHFPCYFLSFLLLYINYSLQFLSIIDSFLFWSLFWSIREYPFIFLYAILRLVVKVKGHVLLKLREFCWKKEKMGRQMIRKSKTKTKEMKLFINIFKKWQKPKHSSISEQKEMGFCVFFSRINSNF